jgi:putative hemolysin|tara:strand:+ start:539 stop:784 length:246 start_codon:yes stop_codon:yes gene_type:complete
MFDPNKGRYQRATAEQALGIDDEEREKIRLVVAVDLLCAHAGITDEQLELAYDARLKSKLADVRDAFRDLVGEDDDVLNDA